MSLDIDTHESVTNRSQAEKKHTINQPFPMYNSATFTLNFESTESQLE